MDSGARRKACSPVIRLERDKVVLQLDKKTHVELSAGDAALLGASLTSASMKLTKGDL